MFDLDSTAANIMPAKYRSVAIAEYDNLEPHALRAHFRGREAYMRTRFIVVRNGSQTALIEVSRPDSTELFSEITEVRLLAGPDQCVYVHEPETDVGIPSHMAVISAAHPDARCVIVEGSYSHVSFLLNPVPLRINVLDIVPPGPSKLADQARRLLDTAEDLPPILLAVEAVDSRNLLAEANAATGPAGDSLVLLPCRVSASEVDGDAVRFLDQRPDHEDWTLLGCQRSQQIHTWFYSEAAPLIDTCPRRFLTTERDDGGASLTRCCLLQEGMERQGRTAIVPWGSSFAEVRAGLLDLIASEGAVWTPT